MDSCGCPKPHDRRVVVLTGGPGAGKTAVLEMFRQCACPHLVVLPEAASIVFGGGFPRGTQLEMRRAGQRAIYHVQRELECVAEDGTASLLCDRGTVDGAAYWPGPGDLFEAVGSTRQAELARYSSVIHLRVPATGYDHSNPLRIESQLEAARIDEAIVRAWDGHPRRFFIDSTAHFFDKARRALERLRDELPACCRHHVSAALNGHPVLRA